MNAEAPDPSVTPQAVVRPATWLPDASHYPEQMTPLSATTWFEAVGRGLHEAMRELQGPFGGFEARAELGWAYEGELQPEWQPEEGRLHEAARELRRRWQEDLRPRAHAVTRELHAMRPDLPDPSEATALLNGMWSIVLEQWKVHFLVVVPAQVAIELFTDAYRTAFPAADALAPYGLLDGMPNESTEADAELWQLAQRARSLGVADIVREFPEESVLDRLDQSANGRALRHELSAYLRRFGGRSRWHEVSLPREVEQPTMTLDSLRLFLEADVGPSLIHRAGAERRERQALESAPEIREALEAAKVGYGLKESHAYHIDYPGLLALREVLLGFGRRLVAEGRLSSLADVWMLRRDELRSVVGSDLGGAEVGAIVRQRRAELERGRREGPRDHLGAAPATTERHPTLEKFYGTGPNASEGDLLRGAGASPGTAEGRVRIVRGSEDFRRVQRGDILVATTTTPAWTPLFPSLGGLVTETGGILSHVAIVAREYGIPTVVGVARATTLLRDGVRVRIDGSRGEVRLLG
jgi:rifampicin phosphotransferase